MDELIVIKIGGVAGDCLTEEFFQKIHTWKLEGKKIIIIHGGGHYISEMMTRLSVPVCHKKGLRITTKEVLKITQMVLIGQVQPMITSCFQQKNLSAVGLNASSDGIILGDYLDKASLGHVGKVTEIRTELLIDLLEKGYIPIVAPLGITSSGHWLNINADDTACHIASALQAKSLYLLTDTAGIMKEGEYLEAVSTTEIAQLIEEQVITGGMIPKVKSAVQAAQAGVDSIHITDDILKTGTAILGKQVLV